MIIRQLGGRRDAMIIRQLRDELLNGEDPYEATRILRGSPVLDRDYPHTFLPKELIRACLLVTRTSFWLEIGSMVGGSAIRTVEVADEEGFGTEVVCIDPFCADRGAWLASGRRKPGEWDCLKIADGAPTIRERFVANVIAVGMSDRILPFPVTSTVGIAVLEGLLAEDRLSEPPGVIYLDASHDEEETLLEMRRAWRLLPPGGDPLRG